MATITLTPEQEAVINHPLGKHARVLAVAGSGKTSTMVHRIKKLVVDLHVNPSTITVLMFNRLARIQFEERLAREGVPPELRPQVNTFHSFSYQLIQEAITRGILPAAIDFWGGDKEELKWLYVNQVIAHLEKLKAIPVGMVDPDEALEAIELWKGSLIPPPRAGYKGNPHIPKVYEQFETRRIRENAITFDDFVPLAVALLESGRALGAFSGQGTQHLIVDEYQDVNYGQQCLVELLAGDLADVMVVGDDDQTIYEWRGARPNYIIREFRSVFSNKPHVDYTLSRSFRFGPVIAQCAHNTIGFNTTRVDKRLLAHFIQQPAAVHVYVDQSEQVTDANKELADQIVTLVKSQRVHPSKIIVLGRMFAQLAGLESECLSRRIPYKVLGRSPFFERREIRALLAYLAAAMALDRQVDARVTQNTLLIANLPSRYLTRAILQKALQSAEKSGATLRGVLTALAESPDTPFSMRQRERVTELEGLLDRLRERITGANAPSAGVLLEWLVDSSQYLKHFDDYYGQSEHSYDRKRAVEYFLTFAKTIALPATAFLEYVDKLDPTRGAPDDQVIIMTTVFRTKGLEYDYVFIPSCTEGYMPCLFGVGNFIYDTEGIVREPEPSEIIENERRLFYVAVTRAKNAVFFGTSLPPAKGSQRQSGSTLPSRFLDEIQFEPTVAIMDAVQGVASGSARSAERLFAGISRFGGLRGIMDNLIFGYLQRLPDDSLVARASQLVAACPEMPFAYSRAYQPPSVGTPKKTHQLASPWDHVTF